MDVVIHAMAVSDFGFKRDKSIKLKSNSPEAFIEYMKENIVVNPKILSHIKEWNPDCYLVSFKFEVGLTLSELIKVLTEDLTEGQCFLFIFLLCIFIMVSFWLMLELFL